MKRKNPISVWTFPYRPRYYITHPWKIIKDIYWNIRNFWHRGRFGYAYVDVWDFCNWYPRVAAEALRYMADHHSGYPGCPPWDTSERWEEHLRYLANQLQRCADSQDICFEEERNEYSEEFHEAFKNLVHHREELPNGMIRTWYDETPEYLELRDKYFAREKEIAAADKQYTEEVYKFLGANLERYWD